MGSGFLLMMIIGGYLFLVICVGFGRAVEPSVGVKDDLVCYQQVGCFSPEYGPLAHLNMLPSDPEEISTEFWITARQQTVGFTVVPAMNASELGSLFENFDPSLPMIFIIHGFADAPNATWVDTLTTRLLYRVDATVVVVNWFLGADSSNYFVAARNTELIGRQLGNLAEAAMLLGVSPKNMHFIGHSLGSHIANFVVYWLRQVSIVVENFTPKRITALDPAGPYFCDTEYQVDTFLEATDAEFVDVYHTNQGKFIYGHVGCEKSVGHVDFYPNGGYSQPGCENPIFGFIEDMFSDGEESHASCSHFRSVHIFSESLVREDEYFRGFPCPNLVEFQHDFVSGDCFSCEPSGKCGKMGLDAEEWGRGDFYLLTYGDTPADGFMQTLGGRMMRISVLSSPQDSYTWGQFVVEINDRQLGPLGPFELNKEDETIPESSLTSKVFLRNETFSIQDNFMEVTLEYKALDGFAFDGAPYWFVDKVMVEDDLENRYYGCLVMLQLETGVPVPLTLTNADC